MPFYGTFKYGWPFPTMHLETSEIFIQLSDSSSYKYLMCNSHCDFFVKYLTVHMLHRQALLTWCSVILYICHVYNSRFPWMLLLNILKYFSPKILLTILLKRAVIVLNVDHGHISMPIMSEFMFVCVYVLAPALRLIVSEFMFTYMCLCTSSSIKANIVRV